MEQRPPAASDLRSLDATVEDVPALAHVFRHANPHAAPSAIAAWTLTTAGQPAGAGLLRKVVTPDGTVVGGAAAWLRGDVAVLDDLALEPEYRGTGLGARLWDEVVAWATRAGAARVRLEVHWQCSPALPWYYRRGARAVELRRDGFGAGHDAFVLELELRGAGEAGRSPARGGC